MNFWTAVKQAITLYTFFSQNRAKRLSLAPGAGISEHSPGCTLPNMADVLKGLGKVKLRSVER